MRVKFLKGFFPPLCFPPLGGFLFFFGNGELRLSEIYLALPGEKGGFKKNSPWGSIKTPVYPFGFPGFFLNFPKNKMGISRVRKMGGGDLFK